MSLYLRTPFGRIRLPRWLARRLEELPADHRDPGGYL